MPLNQKKKNKGFCFVDLVGGVEEALRIKDKVIRGRECVIEKSTRKITQKSS